jgi:hypothetical protein
MLIDHPGSWQQFQYRSDNKGLSVMKMKSKYLHEQLLFEAQIENLNQIHQHNLFMNGSGGGGGSYNTPITYYGMYINEFSSILGSAPIESDLISFIQNKGMNDLTFYMGNLLSTPQNETNMRSLASRLRNTGQNRILSNVIQAANSINLSPGTEATYNNGCSNDREKFTGFTQEWEFWNSNNPYGSFGVFITDDVAIANYCQANNLTYDIYVSRCEDYADVYTPGQVATHVVQYHDIVHLVAYISEATYNLNKGLNTTRKTQLELLGNAALALGKKQKVTILWAANGNEGVNMRDWFVANPDLNAYDGFITEYNNWSSFAKAGLDIVGQKIYAYSGISDL